MHDELNAIRRLYGEPGTEGPPSDPPAGLDALADVKAALDRLPPQRPDPSLIDAVVAAGREAARAAALAPIRAVYDEEPEPLASEQAEAEAAALAQVKAALDRLPPQRPAASVIDAVVAAAVTDPHSAVVPATAGRAADRPAERSTRRRAVVALSAVFAVVLVFGGGFWLSQDATTPQELVAERFEADGQAVDAAPPVAEAPAEEPESSEESSDTAAPSAPPVTGQLATAVPQRSAAGAPSGDAQAADADEQSASARRAEAAVPAPASPAAVANADDVMRASEESLPLADGDEELQLLYLRVREMQAAQAGLGWDTPPVSLGAAPDSTPAATGWMQVRVQR